jgi:UDP-glucose:(heptosyl)LPS alpha-1,3-glucosyltransferase
LDTHLRNLQAIQLLLRIAVLSPTVNRRRGTERAVAELVDGLARRKSCEVHLFAQEVEDVAVIPYAKGMPGSRGIAIWHRITRIPGPHLLQFLFWLVANRVARGWNNTVDKLQFDVVFSPGINALDADVILVHAVFHRLRELQASRVDKRLRWVHRALYYHLLCFLESWQYRRKNLRLAGVSCHTADQLNRHFGRRDVSVIPNGVDATHFSEPNRKNLRSETRQEMGFAPHEAVLLLVGNDFQNKGLDILLQAVRLRSDLPLRICVVGHDCSYDADAAVVRAQLQGRVTFCGETRDILPFYAAADIYVAPSLEDSFNLPTLEAMACGLPVIVSRNAGVTEYLTDGSDSVLLRNARDCDELANAIGRLVENPRVAAELSSQAIKTAASLSWSRHEASVYELLTCDSRGDGGRT